MSSMSRWIRFLFLALILIPCLDSGQPFTGTAETVSEFDILGLKLEMTAQQAAATIQQRLKLPSESIKMDSTPRHYQGNGTFVDDCVISSSDIELVLIFTEVFPGQGTGPESLYFISYTPKSMFAEDREEFANLVVAKFGAPTATLNHTHCIWVLPPHKSREAALRAGSPLLELDRSTATLSLWNPAIRRRMEDAFRQTQKLPL
jgi:hypothetical protein